MNSHIRYNILFFRIAFFAFDWFNFHFTDENIFRSFFSTFYPVTVFTFSREIFRFVLCHSIESIATKYYMYVDFLLFLCGNLFLLHKLNGLEWMLLDIAHRKIYYTENEKKENSSSNMQNGACICVVKVRKYL